VASMIAWLDTSSDEQRRVRELISLFVQSESRDELGIGQIRDAFSDLLFPGTSVIQTRARYFLFVPWIFRDGARRGYSGPQLKAWADRQERKLVEALRDTGQVEGLIGRRAGPAVKTLPSAIYWSGLLRYGILTRDVASDQLDGQRSDAGAEADELAVRRASDWDPTLPEAPAGFPGTVTGGFDLTRRESVWLRERILTAAPDTLLSHLLVRDEPPDPDSVASWDDSACADAPAGARAVHGHARLFSLGMHGAALLYNLLIGERYERAGYTRIHEPVTSYRGLLDDWAVACSDAGAQFRTWDRHAMWDHVTRVNPRIDRDTRRFVDTWLDTVTSGNAAAVAMSNQLRQLVSHREQTQKEAQSRLTNDRLLRTWSGKSGSATLTYRWPRVRDIVTDIHEGLTRDARA
jgi:Family of unknown function (DUF6361)